jgi:hypothetical protein
MMQVWHQLPFKGLRAPAAKQMASWALSLRMLLDRPVDERAAGGGAPASKPASPVPTTAA